MRHEPTYQTWHSMVRRCHWPHHKDYHRYGGRGIKVDNSWRNYHQFLADMGQRPEGYTLDRIDNNKGYTKTNCRWCTPTMQNFNRRVTHSSKSGVTGVCLVNKGKAWRAYGKIYGIATELYRGPSLEAAIAARKAWEKTVWPK